MPGAEAQVDLSLVALFMHAHFIVKLVMIGLAVASVWSWAIIINKSIAMRSMAKSMDEFEDRFWSGQSLDELYRGLVNKTNDGFAALFIAAMTEWRRAFEGSGRGFASLQTRIDKVLDVSIAREVERLESKLLALATIASVGPYIGLFGTVFGIMTTFRSIAASKNTSLAVVAPGIAEALFATAIALAAAIPANIFYNKFVRDAGKIQGRLESFADEFSAILSRQIDERAGTVQNRGAA
ncbi:MAG: protein TolQ [Methylobacterium sp.]|jgi:biopolymer transport protein TolQ|nr:protein TolQ [Methylobacterium sp.]MCZ8269475.1 protein TolQ [Beijerinckiaceae bacterium]MCA3654863.1 protein TolQ [Methylobacterium sp.]MCA3658817.1 protein TolQ [Methylobacterium sp.]MCA3664417.1 protein TolQ [Methylobacterium sp.]